MENSFYANQPKMTSSELTAQITRHVQQLAQATDAARVSEEMLRYLEFCSRFHQYSVCNIYLILMFCPQARQVAGYQTWKNMQRHVRKGEHGIPILAPIFAKKEKDDIYAEDSIVGFKVVYVFDISQTEGEPLPEPPDWKSPEKNQELADRLVRFAHSRGITVSERQLERDVQGVSRGGAIELDPSAGIKTLIHEIAHELMHKRNDRSLSRGICEMEAEAVAYVVTRHFGIDSTLSSNYVALHGASSKEIMEHLERIRVCALDILMVVEYEILPSSSSGLMISTCEGALLY